MRLARILRHLAAPDWLAARRFPGPLLDAVESAVEASEASHRGEIRFAVEAALPWGALLAGQNARERAVGVFARLGVWDTEENTGVLIYLLLADRDVEIVADRGIARAVPQAEWEAVCRAMEAHFREGRWREGALEGVRRVGELLAAHFPAGKSNPDELPDRPEML